MKRLRKTSSDNKSGFAQAKPVSNPEDEEQFDGEEAIETVGTFDE